MNASSKELTKHLIPSILPDNNSFQNIIGTFMGRDALTLAVSYLKLKTDDIVLLPAYLCGVVLHPFLGRARIEFYDILPNLTIDPDIIRDKLKEERVKVVLIINYFGFLQPYRKEIRNLCKNRGVFIIEDCAHSLLTDGSGDIGDINIFSFAKILPIPDGGGLKLNIDTEYEPTFHPKIYSNFLSILIMLKTRLKVRSDMLSRAWVSSQKQGEDKNLKNEHNLSNTKSVLPISSHAFRGVRNVDTSNIIEKRRTDYQYWQSFAERTDRVLPIFHELLPGVCPLGYPIKIENRDGIKLILQKKGIFLKTHWNLPNQVARVFSSCHELSMHTITLPVHPELTEKDREVIENVLTK